MQKSVFEYNDYKTYIKNRFLEMPKKGRGQFRKLALHLDINSVIISQVLNGDREFNLEQGIEITDYFGFSDSEKEYFLLLIQFARAGSHRLKENFKNQIQRLKQKSYDIKNRIPKNKSLAIDVQAEFYSSWMYSGIRLLSDLPTIENEFQMSEYFNLDLKKTREILQFLLKYDLVTQGSKGYELGEQFVHIRKNSPLITKHHSNWRNLALNSMGNPKTTDLYFTSPMVLSRKTHHEVRQKILSLIESVMKDIKPSPSETLSCLNIDWFAV
ncbi:MAG: TIGR02147 family protein [Bdellovibrionaceae bacterium]|jgi:uncharacterized protein (TIGR02147 family)|nr:TIGR02147 family protein [Pseudobdellovibrionaceae bacterium]